MVVTVNIIVTDQKTLGIIIALGGRQFWEPVLQDHLLVYRLILRQAILKMHGAPRCKINHNPLAASPDNTLAVCAPHLKLTLRIKGRKV